MKPFQYYVDMGMVRQGSKDKNTTIIIEKANGNYSAYCPDLPSVIATGMTTEETIHKMKEAIEFHLEGLKEEEVQLVNKGIAKDMEDIKNDKTKTVSHAELKKKLKM